MEWKEEVKTAEETWKRHCFNSITHSENNSQGNCQLVCFLLLSSNFIQPKSVDTTIDLLLMSKYYKWKYHSFFLILLIDLELPSLVYLGRWSQMVKIIKSVSMHVCIWMQIQIRHESGWTTMMIELKSDQNHFHTKHIQ